MTPPSVTLPSAEPARATRAASSWRVFGRSWRVIVPTVALEAVVQGLLVLPDPVPTWGWRFSGLVLLSLVLLLVGLWLVSGATVEAAVGRVAHPVRRIFRHWGIPLWALAVLLVAVAAGLLEIWLTPVLLMSALFVLPAAAAGHRPVLVMAWRPFRATPVRAVLLVVAGLLLAAISWAAALLLGLFVSGAASAMLIWLWFGLVASGLLAFGARMQHRGMTV